MNECEMEKFACSLIAVGEIYGRTISERLIEIYWRSVCEYDVEDIICALNSHIKNPDTGAFFPKPSDIVRSIEGSTETKALLAWTKVEKTIKQVGRYESVVFDDELIHAVIEDMGGWIYLCSMSYDDLPFRANEFKKRYMGFINKKPNRHPRVCFGIFELENSKNGFDVAPPIFVGDPQKSKQVMMSGGGEHLTITQGKLLYDIIKQTNLLSERTNED